MRCTQCEESIFRQKLGRCYRCMAQLALLSVVGWPLWFHLFVDNATDVKSIALLFFCCAFSGLLAVHLFMWLYYRYIGSNERH
ncbi:DUF3624 domain-containing protein [Shewanella aestuarii]|uniref:DUF3624 domain-containing protein n=1 Tax=Shewanella aestuarii TaxID=1028752 RepID=A0A6G9QNK7_9GAMM|nr:DUF3624 domain-containing protein [Shewanella aestuarii]QIR16180.1 DUF3624 domain-containing protein [Shewanella aestuarii]